MKNVMYELFDWTLAIAVCVAIVLLLGAFGVLVTGVLITMLVAYVVAVVWTGVSSLFPTREPSWKRERRTDDGDVGS